MSMVVMVTRAAEKTGTHRLFLYKLSLMRYGRGDYAFYCVCARFFSSLSSFSVGLMLFFLLLSWFGLYGCAMLQLRAVFCVNCQSVYLCTRFKFFFWPSPHFEHRQWHLTACVFFALFWNRFINPFHLSLGRRWAIIFISLSVSIKLASIYFFFGKIEKLSRLEHTNLCMCAYGQFWICYKYIFIAADSP